MSSHPEITHLLPSVSAVRESAALAGSHLLASPVRPSVNAASGWVVSAVFNSLRVANQFARAWSGRLPAACRGCIIRAIAAGAWAVSVPVQGPAPEASAPVALPAPVAPPVLVPASPWWCPVSWPVVAGGAA